MIYDLKRIVTYGIALMMCLVGCVRRDGLTEIRGTVVYDGQPVQKGAIAFLPVGGSGPTAAGIIADGRYAVKVAPGPKQVRIEAFRITGQRRYSPNDLASPMIDVLQQILPERYNAKTELTCEITPTADAYDFAMQKSPAVRSR